MNLQVQRLTGPDQIHEVLLPTNFPTDDDNLTTTTRADEHTNNVFICELGWIPQYQEQTLLATEPVVSITLRFFDHQGTDIHNDQILQLTRQEIQNRRAYFSVHPGRELTGTRFYVQALIHNDENGTNEVSFSNSNYHETIKQVYMYETETLRFVYWSDADTIRTVERQEGPQTTAAVNDRRYVHIKTTGLYSETVSLRILEGELELVNMNVPLNRNQASVEINMREMLNRYVTQNALDRATPQTVALNLTASVTYSTVRNDAPFTLQGVDTVLTLNANISDLTRPSPFNDGAVYTVVDGGANPGAPPPRYQDFRIGYMCHVEGIGKLAQRQSTNPVTTAQEAHYTVYPFHVYEIRLSDLVDCGLVTLDEAAYLTALNKSDLTVFDSETNLRARFNKSTAKLSATKTLLSIFQDASNGNLSHSGNIRKVLTAVRHKTSAFTGPDVICRDGWEKVTTSSADRTIVTKMHSRPDAERYSRNKECPYGEFFLNYVPGSTYLVFVSRHYNNTDIDLYAEDRPTGRPASPNRILRSAVALHRGGADFSTGCMTFNVAYTGQINNNNNNQTESGVYSSFVNTIYQGGHNNAFLNFICIDERNAIQIANDTDTYHGENKSVFDTGTNTTVALTKNQLLPFRRFYDLVKPTNKLPPAATTAQAGNGEATACGAQQAITH